MLNHVDWHGKRCASFNCHVEYVEYVECLGSYQGLFGGVSSKTFSIFNRINMTTERSHFGGGGGDST